MAEQVTMLDLQSISVPSNSSNFWIYDPISTFPKDRKITITSFYNKIKLLINEEAPLLNLSINGNAATVSNGVYTVGIPQTISSEKTFTAKSTFNGIVEINNDLTINGNFIVSETAKIPITSPTTPEVGNVWID